MKTKSRTHLIKSDMDIWKVSDVLDLFDTKRTTLLKAEKDGRIPSATRKKIKGKETRVWEMRDLPQIGANYGFLKKPENIGLVSIAMFTVKGGVNKTSLSLIFARLMALNGLRVLLVGNDPQSSLTANITNPIIKNLSIDELEEYSDVSEVLSGNISLEDAVIETTLPNLDLLPENETLEGFGEELSAKTMVQAGKGRKHRPVYSYYSDILMPKIKEAGYDVVIFDNGPALTTLNKNSVFACDFWITPNSCDQGSIQVFENNLNAVFDFAEDAGKEWKDVILVPTMKENTKLSKQIHAMFANKFPEFITENYISKRVFVQEALVHAVSPNEAYPSSDFAQEYKNLLVEVWNRIIEKI